MRRMLLTASQHERMVALLDIAGRADNSTPEEHDLDLSLRACLAAAPQVAQGSKYLLPLDDIELNILGAMVSHRLCTMLDAGHDAPHLQRLHEQICLVAKLLPLLRVCRMCQLGSTEFSPAGTGCSVRLEHDPIAGTHRWEAAPGLHDTYLAMGGKVYLCNNCQWQGDTEGTAIHHMRHRDDS